MVSKLSKEERKSVLEIIMNEMNVTQYIKAWKQSSPFVTLVRTILSQNTTDQNAMVAFDNLQAMLKIDPETLAYADVSKIQEAIHVAGLQKQKSQRIKDLAKVIYFDWKNDFKFVYSASLKEAREKLMKLPGIGKRSADILLNFCGNRPVMPVERNITRIVTRLGFVGEDADYDEIRHSIQGLITADKILYMHFALIFFGAQICKATNPQCEACPITNLCPKIGLD